ncbi:MAG TPA: carbohydrate kinase, partial [Ktedonobacteraceae bacterium]|nr:carbohydrate kinase [Ktedonobacteraceae bacterium]
LLGSSTLQHIIADTLGAALYPSHNHEASARGAALLALEAMGLIPDVTQVPADLASPVLPNEKHGTIYRRAAARQRELYGVLLGE